jgi:transcriptional regulator with XRE-family HTH domain
MSDSKQTPKPYQMLGLRLRLMRQKSKESPAEVSGAVEIDESTLNKFESGTELPSEDILMLLINHFGLGDDEAVSLWELAGYDQFDGLYDDDNRRANEELRVTKQPVIVLALDSRVAYTNGAEVITDKNGVIINFTQLIDAKQGQVPVARVGMSYEQAASVLKLLQQALLRGKYLSQTKSLPIPKSSKKSGRQSKDNS